MSNGKELFEVVGSGSYDAETDSLDIKPVSPWLTEFGPEYKVPAAILTAGLVDESWHNDACPAFYYLFDAPNVNETDIVIYVEHPDRAQREALGERFTVCEPNGETVIYAGGNVYDALAALRAEVDKRRATSNA
jgi:hypothetical protein